MEETRRVPEAVMEEAVKCGMNTAKFLGYYMANEVWSIYEVDREGSVVPTGLPLLILYNDAEVKSVYGESAFQIIEELGV